MPKREPTSLACPLCLGLDEPGSMIDVAIERANPPDSVFIALCRRCAYAIVQAVQAGEQPPPLPESIENSDKTDDPSTRN